MGDAPRLLTRGTTSDDFVAAVVRHVLAILTAEEVNAIMFITPRTPERKPNTVRQGVCLSGLSRRRLSANVYVELTEETTPLGRWSPFRLTPLGLAVRREIEAPGGINA